MNISDYVLLLILLQPLPALTMYGQKNAVHHQFNASLLREGEKQISIAGNARYGVNDELELGTQSALLAYSIPNLSFKHKMFATDRSQTTFTAHSLLVRSTDPNQLTFLSLHGIITDFFYNDSSSISYGLLELFAWAKGDDHLAGEFHYLSPMIGADKILAPGWSVTALIFLPVWGYLELVSSYADLSARFDYYSGSKSKEGYPGLLFLSGTKSWDNLNLEVGFFYFNPLKRILPYVNLFWRWV